VDCGSKKLTHTHSKKGTEMVWSHYAEEAYAAEQESLDEPYEMEDEDRGPPEPLEFDDWCTWFSNDLLNMWMSLRAYREDSGTTSYILNSAEYNDFCYFCYQFSRGWPSRFPS
jgi:hypothetical protein